VAVNDGLIVPVIRNVETRGLEDIAKLSKELGEKARTGKLLPDDFTGSTFTISNLGMFGIEDFTAIINPPNAAILSVGAIIDTPVVVNGDIRVQKMMRVTLGNDHRVIDGAVGASFLASLKKLMEDPVRLLL
jgi:pyruvate dehydrogenase E2 component (dihydrolipoamide acetyltransferase)